MNEDTSKALPNAWIAALFLRFQTLYGNKAQTMWGDVDRNELMRVWGEELARFAAVDIAGAVKAMPGAYLDYPPTLPQFASLCSDAKRARAAGATKITDQSGRVPPPPHIAAQLSKFVGRAVFKPKAMITFALLGVVAMFAVSAVDAAPPKSTTTTQSPRETRAQQPAKPATTETREKKKLTRVATQLPPPYDPWLMPISPLSRDSSGRPDWSDDP